MTIRARTPEETYAPAIALAKEQFAHSDPLRIATLASVPLLLQEATSGFFSIPFLGSTYEVHWPEGNTQNTAGQVAADVTTHILLLHYLLTADGTPMANQWIAFRALPGGLGYDAAFQGRANLRLAQRFGSDGAAFEGAAATLAGERLAFGDLSFCFRLLPSLWLAAVLQCRRSWRAYYLLVF